MKYLCTLLLPLILLLLAAPLPAQEDIHLEKPQRVFTYVQVNLAGGYDSAEPGDGWGWAESGPPELDQDFRARSRLSDPSHGGREDASAACRTKGPGDRTSWPHVAPCGASGWSP